MLVRRNADVDARTLTAIEGLAVRGDMTVKALCDYVLDVVTTVNNVGLVDVLSPGRVQRRTTVTAQPAAKELTELRAHLRSHQGPVGEWRQRERRHTIKSVEELREIYVGQDITRDKETTVYCRIGERSSRT